MDDYNQEKNNYEIYSNVQSFQLFGNNKDVEYDLSVVIPTYNRPNLLRKALKSLKQDMCGLKVEIIVVDNAQCSFSESVIEKIFLDCGLDNIKYFQNENNIGMFGNWNRCIELASATWIAMLHDDDIVSDDYFLKIKKILKKLYKQPDVVYVRANAGYIIGDKKQEYNGLKNFLNKRAAGKILVFGSKDLDYIGPERIGLFGISSCGSLINKSVYLKYGGFDETHYPSSDAQYPAKLVSEYGFKIGLTLGILGYYRWEDNTSYKERTIKAWAEEYAMYSKYYSKRSSLSKRRYRLYKNEMSVVAKEYFIKCLNDSSQIENKQAVEQYINELLPTEKNKIRYWWYTKTFQLYYRIKQIIALFFG